MRIQIAKHVSCEVGARLVCLALFMATASCLCGQEKSAANPAQSADSSQPAQHDYRFEVASIRQVELTGFAYGDPRLNPHFDPGLYRVEQVNLDTLVAQAFEIKRANQQMETPRWMNTEYFTINAVPAEGATKADLPIMLRHLLEDRFGLKYHHETRQMAGYQLVVAKSGPRLTKSPAPASERKLVKGLPEIKNGVPQFAKDSGSGLMIFRNTAFWRGRNETMEGLATQLTGRLDAPVADATGLEGEYDFDLIFTPEVDTGGGTVVSPLPPPASPNPTAGGNDSSAPMEHPLLRDALREQLGLELRPVKNVSVDVVIIDSANKVPTAN